MTPDEVLVSGTVRGIQTRTEVSGGGNGFSASSSTILVFRLEPADGSRPINVELRGWRINGTVVDGESVDVYGREKAPGVFQAARILSRDTGATIQPEVLAGGCKFVALAFGFLLLLIAIGAVIWIVVARINDDRKPDRRPTVVPTEPVRDPRERARQECLANDLISDEECRRLFP